MDDKMLWVFVAGVAGYFVGKHVTVVTAQNVQAIAPVVVPQAPIGQQIGQTVGDLIGSLWQVASAPSYPSDNVAQ